MPKAKVIIIGQSTVGKSCLALRIKNDEFNEYVAPTIGAANITVQVEGASGNKVEFNIWDTAGQEKYRSLTPMYFTGASVALIVFDLSRDASFQTLNDFDSLLSQKAPDDIVKVLVGNKCDLVDAREVPRKAAEEYARAIGAEFYIECSAKTGDGVKELFSKIVDIPTLRTESNEDDEFVELTNLQSREQIKKKEGCC
jgi:small GTP-binding protein